MEHLERFAASDGAQIFLKVDGRGPPVVLLHEWASSHRVWETIARRLAGRFTVYRWDARGHAGHDSDHAATADRQVTVERMAEDLADLLEHYRLEKPLMVGHSMGALTLWAHLGRFGCGRIGRICILDQSPRLTTDLSWQLGIYGDWPEERDDRFVAAMRADFVQAVVELVAYGLNAKARARYETGHPGIERMRTYLAMLDPRPLIAVWHTLSRADFRPVLPTIDVPALLIYGTESNFYPPATGPFVRSAIPGARLVMYEGADHSPHLSQPDRFVADLTRFAETA
jgi:pimeloyl-ACP methyl ester carboxylesterase